ncbi:MAG: winged helix-turn-helix domain-containing protein [Candidatus Caldarchaeum sp.]
MASQLKPPEENEKIANVFAALGHPHRLRILEIVSASERPLHIKGVARIIKTRYAITYKHVKILREAGLVTIYEVGRSRVVAPRKPDLYLKIAEFAKNLISEK